MSTPRAYVYGYGMLGTTNPTGSNGYDQAKINGPTLGSGDLINRLQAASIRDAGFTDLILWTLHVWPNGDVYWGDSLAASCGEVNAAFKAAHMDYSVADLKRSGGLRVVFGIGDGGKVGDFRVIEDLSTADYQTFLSNLQALTTFAGTDGFDFDMEVYIAKADFVAQLVLDIVAMKNSAGNNLMVSFSPTTAQQSWVVPVLEHLYGDVGSQPVSWLNVQTYGGVSDGIVNSWTKVLTASTGVADPLQFVGFALAVAWNGYFSPSGVRQQFAGLTQKPGGGGLWNSSEIFNNVYSVANAPTNNPSNQPEDKLESTTPGAYAQAILSGLS